MIATPEQLQDAVTKVEAALALAEKEIGPHEPNQSAYWDRRRTAMAVCAERLRDQLDARITDGFDAARVRIAGVQSSCTAGLTGALQNWIVAARRKIEAAS